VLIDDVNLLYNNYISSIKCTTHRNIALKICTLIKKGLVLIEFINFSYKSHDMLIKACTHDSINSYRYRPCGR